MFSEDLRKVYIYVSHFTSDGNRNRTNNVRIYTNRCVDMVNLFQENDSTFRLISNEINFDKLQKDDQKVITF